MKRATLACIASAVSLLPLAAAGAAQASSAQDLGQKAGNEQVAGSSATSVQDHPSNENISVRIGSPGNDGPVTQTNSSAASSSAGNDNSTSQTASQSGAGAQSIGQGASNAQAALSAAKSVQLAPENENISVRIHSPGSNGPVTQSNTSTAHSSAGNDNRTEQAAAQWGSGPGQQSIGQGAKSEQLAKSLGGSLQQHPANESSPVRIKGAGSDGPVSQSNASHGASTAGGTNGTTQQATQSGGGATTMLDGLDGVCRECSRPGRAVQAIGQDAGNEQAAGSEGVSLQHGALNANGGGGSVKQANTSDATSSAGNHNGTTQSARQAAGGAPGTTVQAIGQSVWNGQLAKSLGASLQDRPTNATAGGGGSVDQRNSSTAGSSSGNTNGTTQTATQTPGGVPMLRRAIDGCRACGSDPGRKVQAIGQDVVNRQGAFSEGISKQICPLNEHVASGASGMHKPKGDLSTVEEEPVRRLVPSGPAQANDAASRSASGNESGTSQGGGQEG